ncbi:MAG: prepilin-type N-terminal cleavage/methylation domain-containing protein [Patescibacteria group bacterium]
MIRSKGFSMLEIMITVAIVAVIAGIVAYSFGTLRARKQLEITVDSIGSKLEEAKANALAGKGGTSFGIVFASTTYTYFRGTTYSSSDPANVVYNLASNLEITRTLSGGGSQILFARLTGLPSATGTLSVRSSSPSSTTARIIVGTYGDISVIK